MMRTAVFVSTAAQVFAGNCCWSKWGDASSCGNFPAGGAGGICNNDGVTKCSSETDCSGLAPTPSPGPAPTPTSIGSKVLLVGLYQNWGATVNSYALDGGLSVRLLSSADIGHSPSWITASGRRDGDAASLFSVSETDNTVASLSLGCDGKVIKTGSVSSQGAGPVFLAVDATSEHVLCANYGGGSVSVLPVSYGAGGAATLGDATQTMEFGAQAHAHSAYFGQGGAAVYVPTLGLD